MRVPTPTECKQSIEALLGSFLQGRTRVPGELFVLSGQVPQDEGQDLDDLSGAVVNLTTQTVWQRAGQPQIDPQTGALLGVTGGDTLARRRTFTSIRSGG